jgi:hypothetical protein
MCMKNIGRPHFALQITFRQQRHKLSDKLYAILICVTRRLDTLKKCRIMWGGGVPISRCHCLQQKSHSICDSCFIQHSHTPWGLFVILSPFLHLQPKFKNSFFLRLKCFPQSFKAYWEQYVSPALTINIYALWPQSLFVCFIWSSQQTVVISLNGINWLIFAMVMGCVSFGVRTQCSNIMKTNCGFGG